MSVELKDSGLSWVGPIPVHWSVVPTRAAVTLVKDEVGDAWAETPLLSLTKSGIVPRDIDSGEGKYPASFETYQLVRPKDLVFCLFDIDETPRTVGVVRQDGMITGAYTRFAVNQRVADPNYLGWYYLSIDLAKRFRPLYTGLRKTIQKPRFLAAGLALPPLDEQRAIADYLDSEIAQIDTLIAEQQHLLEVLAERRQAAIAEAVMPSGNPLNDAVGWPRIGHGWDVSLGKMLDAGKAVPVESTSLPYVRAGNIQDHGLDLASVNEMPFTPEEATQFDLRAGDLLVVEGGAVGTNVTLTMDMPGWAFQKTVNRARPVNGGDSRWLGYVLRTYRDSGVLDIVCNKSTIAHLTAEKLRGLPVPPCSNSDQRRIADRVDAEVARLDELSSEATRFIKLARERRAALITAAVTGQIEIPED